MSAGDLSVRLVHSKQARVSTTKWFPHALQVFGKVQCKAPELSR